MAIALLRANTAMDVRPVLPAVRVPSLVLQRTDDVLVEVGHGRYLAEHLPGARYTELAGRDHWPWLGDSESVLAPIAEFLTSLTAGSEAPDEVRPACIPGWSCCRTAGRPCRWRLNWLIGRRPARCC
jgi:hypothetical protein